MRNVYKKNYGKGVYEYDYGWFNIDKVLKIIDEPDKLKLYILKIIFKKKKYLKLENVIKQYNEEYHIIFDKEGF